MVVHGAQAGGFSPISVYGVIVNGVVSDVGLPQDEIALFLSSLIFNLLVGIVMFVLFGGLALMRSGRASAAQADERAAANARRPPPMTRPRTRRRKGGVITGPTKTWMRGSVG